jgi:cytochrome P450
VIAPTNPGAAVPMMDVNFNSPEMAADPWPTLRRIREAGPIVWNDRGHWMTAQDSICRQLLNKPGLLGNHGTMAAIFGSDAFIAIDDKPRHNSLRNVWMAAFKREAMERLTPTIRLYVDRMLDGMEERLREGGRVDVTSALCAPLPPTITAYMLGIPEDMLGSILEWSDHIATAASGGWPIDYERDPAWLRGEAAKRKLGEYLFEQIQFRREHPGDDLISQLVHSEIGRAATDDVLMMNIRQLLFGGSETTQKWLGHILVTLSRRPELRTQLAGNPALLPAALEEIMRWETVVQTDPRTVKGNDVVVGGVPLRDGAEVILLLGGANRDPERYPDPDRLDIRRETRAHLGFGFGLHSCLGVTLARVEALVVTSALLERIPDYVIAEPVKYNGFNLRGPDALHMTRSSA